MPVCRNPGNHTDREISMLAQIARREVENYEAPTSRNQARQRSFLRTQDMNRRKLKWMTDCRAWLRLRHDDFNADERPSLHILKLNNWHMHPGSPPLLVPAVRPLEQEDENCTICMYPLWRSQQEWDSADPVEQQEILERGEPVALPCFDNHRFHVHCLQRYLEDIPDDPAGRPDYQVRRCPLCRSPYRILYEPGFGEPEWNYDFGSESYWQVGGFIDFMPVVPSRLQNFRRYEVYDRWGTINHEAHERFGNNNNLA
ncbi:hypothetical protein LZ554_007822 [Drepanopeziza brunnea f. sp. 'monogermtubi']|nr:hypothetical protein LZ554_007822 [Drepanopeziza brunnea f. sp. 'monogermtubi']